MTTTVPVAPPIDVVVDVAVLGLICLALWCSALSRLFSILVPGDSESGASRWMEPQRSVFALLISVPVAYYLFWLLMTPPAVLSASGVTRGPGPPYYTSTTIRWSDTTAVHCTYPIWWRWRRRFELSVVSGTEKLWIGRVTRVRAEELLEELQAHVPADVIRPCPNWTEFPALRGMK